jgi:hypothetical protein
MQVEGQAGVFVDSGTRAFSPAQLQRAIAITLLQCTPHNAAMAPKKSANQPSPAAAPASAMKSTHSVSTASSTPAKQQSKSTSSNASAQIRNAQDAQQIALGVWNNYVEKTPQRVKLLDAFMAFLIVVGVLQFVYCVIAGNYVRFTPLLLASKGVRLTE